MDGKIDPSPAESSDLVVQIIGGPANHIADGGKIAPRFFPVGGVQMDFEIVPVPKNDHAFTDRREPLDGLPVIAADPQDRIDAATPLIAFLKRR